MPTIPLPDEAATRALGARLARVIRPGMSLYLHGDLGSGRELLVTTLSAGQHQINLRAIDGNGMAASASVSVFVGHTVFLPLLLRR